MENSKVWKTLGVYESYDEANTERNKIVNEHQLVKVKRCSKGGNLYKVKFWSEPEPKKQTKKKKSKK